MALNSGTPNTDWLPQDTISNAELNRIEGNTQDLEDTKIEKGSPYDLRLNGGDADVALRFASDASILWDESVNRFVCAKNIFARFGARSGFSLRGSVFLAAATPGGGLSPPIINGIWVPPAGVYMIGSTDSELAFDSLQIRFNTSLGTGTAVHRGAFLVSNGDGTVQVENENTSTGVTLYYLRF